MILCILFTLVVSVTESYTATSKQNVKTEYAYAEEYQFKQTVYKHPGFRVQYSSVHIPNKISYRINNFIDITQLIDTAKQKRVSALEHFLKNKESEQRQKTSSNKVVLYSNDPWILQARQKKAISDNQKIDNPISNATKQKEQLTDVSNPLNAFLIGFHLHIFPNDNNLTKIFDNEYLEAVKQEFEKHFLGNTKLTEDTVVAFAKMNEMQKDLEVITRMNSCYKSCP